MAHCSHDAHGQKVVIRYNPANPDEFYLRGVLESRVKSAVKWGFAPALLAIYWLVMLFLNLASRLSSR